MFCHAMPFYSYDVPHTCGPDPKVCCQFDFRRLPGSKYNCPWRIPPQAITDSNVAERARTLLDQYRKKSQLYKTGVVLAPLGDDFRYDKADEWDLQYNNYQKLFDYINKHPELGAEAQFGTLTDYFDAVHEETKQTPSFFPSLSGDFFTYADKDDHYWSGYFTSRPFHKNMDRVVEANLRSAEIIFTLAQAYARKNRASNFPSVEMMKKLVTARRSLGLFQHHDAIAGTAKDFVINDYGERLLEGLTGAKQVMAESAAFLVVKDKGQYKYDAAAPILDLDQVREAHDSLPLRPVIQLSSTPTQVIVYNSLGHRRVQLVSVFVTQASVEVTNPYGSVVHSQTQPFFVDSNTVTDGSRFKVSFVAEVPALGVAVYTLKQAGDGQDTKNHLASTTFINPKSSVNSQGAFSIRSTTGNEDFSIKNSVLEATFDGSSGLLKLVKTLATGEERKTYVKFALFGARNTKEKSGAYLFLPDGPGQNTDEIKPVIRITRGPMVSEVHVFTKYVHHVVRLVNTPGVDALSLDIHNMVDIRTLSNREISMRIHTDIANDDRIFYTDLNGFQMQRRQTYDKLPLQGNVYPMPSSMFIQDSAARFSILSAQSLGVFVSKPGQVDIMLDRRLNQDDGRGLQQGVLDNRLTPNHFRLLLETRKDVTQTKSPGVAFPSHLSNVASLHLMQPLFAMPRSAKHAHTPLTFLSEFSPMNVELPCEVHLVNLRTLQNKDDSADLKYVPRDSAAMLLHHMGGDCSFPLHGVSCRPNDGKVSLAQMFSELKLNDLHETTLTLMHDLEEVDAVMEFPVPPMEIKTFKAALS
ncbi:hypothetical protein V1264_005212 [Littorina saxatilis]|uniref:Alpha-mannosidase n=2 Tax=Littorina saxatilis TaxID=31220 RepID=A0AAN9G584_9CAEN